MPTSVTAGLPLRPPQRVAARQHEPAALVGAVVAGQRLVDRPRGEPEVGGLPVRSAEPRQRVQQRPLEVLAERRLPEGAARLADPDRRRDDRLVRAALGRERDARRRADQDRLPARVDAERPRLERAADERVVDRPDRQQRLAVAAPGRAELARAARPGSSPRCRARCGGPPVVSCQCTSVWVSSANQSRRSPTDQIPDLLIQPPRFVELATSGLTVTTRSATSGASCTRSTKKRPKACWVDSLPRCLRPSVGRHLGRRARLGLLARERRRGGGRELALRAARVEGRPRVLRVRAQLASRAPRTARWSAARSGSPGAPRSAATSP